MPPKPNARNRNDVQTAIATAAIVTTLGLWNLFATPAKTVTPPAQPQEPTNPPPTEPPVAAQETVSIPKVKIMFTQSGSQTVSVSAGPSQPSQVQPQVKKKKKNNSNSGGGSPSVTQTKSS